MIDLITLRDSHDWIFLSTTTTLSSTESTLLYMKMLKRKTKINKKLSTR
jgi:hypothetical protein